MERKRLNWLFILKQPDTVEHQISIWYLTQLYRWCYFVKHQSDHIFVKTTSFADGSATYVVDGSTTYVVDTCTTWIKIIEPCILLIQAPSGLRDLSVFHIVAASATCHDPQNFKSKCIKFGSLVAKSIHLTSFAK